MNKRILIIGQLPPPFHGSNVMAKLTVSSLKNEMYQVKFIDKSFSKNIETIGKPSLRKIVRIPGLAIEIIIACLFKPPKLCLYFIACGKPAFLIDTFLLFIVRICGIPYILRFGGKGFYALQKENFFWHRLVSYSLSNALGGIILGQSIKRDVNLFISNERLVYVPNGTENRLFYRKKEKDKKIQILFLSNLHPSKGPLDVIKAASIVIKQNTKVSFILAGADFSSNYTKLLKSYIKKKGLDEYVTMQGAVHGKEKDNLFSKSDIFVFPTYYERETFGIVNIEAMSWGLPVISSTEGAIPEIIQDGINGFIVNPKSPVQIAEKILFLINNSELRKKMGIESRKIFESKYSIKAYEKNLDRAIKFFLKKINVDPGT